MLIEAVAAENLWWRRRYYIQNGVILPVQGSQVERYDPSDHQSLWFQLSCLGTTGDKSVERFCDAWGPLGTPSNTRFEERFDSHSETVSAFRAASFDIHQCAKGLLCQSETAVSFLNRKTALIRLQAVMQEGSIKSVTAFPCLHDALYWNLAADVIAGRLMACEKCEQPFAAIRPDRAMYCSSRCRETMKKRMQRDRAVALSHPP